jgi:hypothetical protein
MEAEANALSRALSRPAGSGVYNNGSIGWGYLYGKD